jgi:uncharacterized membrane protein
VDSRAKHPVWKTQSGYGLDLAGSMFQLQFLMTRGKGYPLQFKTKFDWWLAGICLARTFNGLVFMTYAATLPVLQREWGMSAAAAGSIAGGFQIGYAVSLVIFSFLADRGCAPKSSIRVP